MKFNHFILIIVLFGCKLSFSQSVGAEHKNNSIEGYIDHVLTTLSQESYDSLAKFLKRELPNSISIVEDNHKLFITPKNMIPYVEIWNSSLIYGVGNQVAFSSNDIQGIAKSKNYYNSEGHNGTFHTIGRETAAGHPYGGNFYVHYKNGGPTNKKDSVEILQLNKIQTITPESLSYIKNDYQFYSLTLNKNDSIIKAKDSRGTQIDTKFVKGTPGLIIGGKFGPVAFYFELSNPLYEHLEEFTIADNMKAVFDGNSMILILKSDAYTTW